MKYEVTDMQGKKHIVEADSATMNKNGLCFTTKKDGWIVPVETFKKWKEVREIKDIQVTEISHFGRCGYTCTLDIPAKKVTIVCNSVDDIGELKYYLGVSSKELDRRCSADISSLINWLEDSRKALLP